MAATDLLSGRAAGCLIPIRGVSGSWLVCCQRELGDQEKTGDFIAPALSLSTKSRAGHDD